MACLHTSTWLCSQPRCLHVIKLTVHAERPLSGGRMSGRTMDRARLLASANDWVIDFNRKAWCPKHRKDRIPK